MDRKGHAWAPSAERPGQCPCPGLCPQASWNQALNASCKVLLAGVQSEDDSGGQGSRPTEFANAVPSGDCGFMFWVGCTVAGPLPELLGLSHPPPCHVAKSAPHHRFSPVCPGETACSTPAPRHQLGTHPRPRGSTRQDRSCSQALLSAATLAKGTPAHACVLTRRPCPSGCWSFVEGAASLPHCLWGSGVCCRSVPRCRVLVCVSSRLQRRLGNSWALLGPGWRCRCRNAQRAPQTGAWGDSCAGGAAGTKGRRPGPAT